MVTLAVAAAVMVTVVAVVRDFWERSQASGSPIGVTVARDAGPVASFSYRRSVLTVSRVRARVSSPALLTTVPSACQNNNIDNNKNNSGRSDLTIG